MSWYTRVLSSLGEKEARRIEVILSKKIKELRVQLRGYKNENDLLKEMLIKAEARHINDITSINSKIDSMSEKLNEWIAIAEDNKKEVAKTKEIARFAEEQRDMWMILVEQAMDKYPDLKLSELLKSSKDSVDE